MTSGREGQQFRLLTVHSIMWSLAMSLASGFVGAYLLRLGFSIAATITMYALLLTARFSLRCFMLPIVRRLGMRNAMLLGASIAAFQFLPLIRADEPLWLVVWVLVVSTGECLYWPICHAANAVSGGRGRRGRQIALRQMANTVISVVAPIVGGMVLTQAGTRRGIRLGHNVLPVVHGAVAVVGKYQPWHRPNFAPILENRRPCRPMRLCRRRLDVRGPGVRLADDPIFNTWDRHMTPLASPAAPPAWQEPSQDSPAEPPSTAATAGHCRTAVMAGLLAGVALRVASGWAPWTAFAANTPSARRSVAPTIRYS